MNRESHIGQPKRRELCGRLFYFDTIQPYKEIFSHTGAGPTLDALRESLFVSLAQELNPPTCNELSDEGLAKTVLAQFVRTAECQLERYPDLLTGLRSTATKKLSELSCLGCSAELSADELHACIGRSGCCFTTLRQSFEIAHEAARLYYSEFGTQTQSLPEVVFSTRHSIDMSDIHDLPISYALAGGTQYCSQNGDYWSRVNLKLCIEKFDFDTYMAVPYVLFHECIAHAFHGLLPSLAAREGCDPDDGFAEGWMDLVAFRILQEVADGKGPAKHLRQRLGFTEEHYHRCYNLYFSRINLDVALPYKPSPYAPHRKSGISAATKVLEALRRLPETRCDPWRSFLQLSFDLNMLQRFTSKRRKQFVALLDNMSKSDQLDTVRHCDAVAIIRKYFQNGDIDSFVANVLLLKDLWRNNSQKKSKLPLFIPKPPETMH